MTHVFPLTLAFILLFDPVATHAKEKLDSAHSRLIKDTQFLTVDFDQEIYSSLRNKNKVRSGQAQFAKPNKFKWTFKNSAYGDEIFYFDGERLSHFLAGQKAVTHYGFKAGFSKELRQIVHLVLSPGQLMSKYDTTKDTKNSQFYTLTPKQPGAEIGKILIRVGPKSNYLQEVSIHYIDGNKSTYKFKNPRTSKIPNHYFRFSNPGGVKERQVG